MTVATFLQTNFNTQSATVYKTAIDGNTAVMAAIGDAFAPHAVATPNMSIQIDAGTIKANGALVIQALQTSGTIVAPAIYPRIDLISIVSATGALVITTGAEASSPVIPAIPSDCLPIGQIYLTITTTAITDSMVSDLRALYVMDVANATNAINATNAANATDAYYATSLVGIGVASDFDSRYVHSGGSGSSPVQIIAPSNTISISQAGYLLELQGNATLPNPAGNTGVQLYLRNLNVPSVITTPSGGIYTADSNYVGSSWTMPASYFGFARLVSDGGNWIVADLGGRTIVSNAVNSNESVAMGQVLGLSQSWTNPGFSENTVYTNTRSKPILIVLSVGGQNNVNGSAVLYVGSTLVSSYISSVNASSPPSACLYALVPPGQYFVFSHGGCILYNTAMLS